jgi:hypothetical protein
MDMAVPVPRLNIAPGPLCPIESEPHTVPGDSTPLNISAADHVYEVDMAVPVPRLNIAPGPLRPIESEPHTW